MSEEQKKATDKKTAGKKAQTTKPAVKANSAGTVRVRQIGSPIGRQKYQRATLIGLGLNKMNREAELNDTKEVRGMIEKVKHLVEVVNG